VTGGAEGENEKNIMNVSSGILQKKKNPVRSSQVRRLSAAENSFLAVSGHEDGFGQFDKCRHKDSRIFRKNQRKKRGGERFPGNAADGVCPQGSGKRNSAGHRKKGGEWIMQLSA
jgi:hypothetical protein